MLMGNPRKLLSDLCHAAGRGKSLTHAGKAQGGPCCLAHTAVDSPQQELAFNVILSKRLKIDCEASVRLQKNLVFSFSYGGLLQNETEQFGNSFLEYAYLHWNIWNQIMEYEMQSFI